MKRWAGLILLLVVGCSTAPIADLLDFFKPGRIEPGPMAPYGGVSAPHPGIGSPPIGPAIVQPPIPSGPTPGPPPVPAGGSVPPPASPPSAPAAGVTPPLGPPPSF